MRSSTEPPTALLSLRRRWLAFTLFSLLYLAGGALLIRQSGGQDIALRWLLQGGIVTGYLLGVFGRSLAHNHRAGESSLLPDLGPGNLLTLLRGLLLAGVIGFWFAPRPAGALAWTPAVLYGLAVTADFLDGWAARVSGRATRLGEILDMSFDGVGMVAAALLAIQWGQVPLWYLPVPLARTVFVAILELHRRRGGRVYELSPSVRRRAFAGVQMGFLVAMLWPIFTPPGTHLAAALFSLPFLVGFVYDGLLATGALRPPAAARPIPSGWLGFLSAMLRLAAAGLLLAVSYQRGSTVPFWLTGMGLILALLLMIGAAGRIVAILSLLLLGGVQYLSGPLTAIESALLVMCVAILFLGTGRFSAWTPEDRWIYHRAGERREPDGTPAGVKEPA